MVQELENEQFRYWTTMAKQGKLVSDIDKNLLNVSVADGGFGYTVKGRPAVRATLVQINKASASNDGNKYIDTIIENNY